MDIAAGFHDCVLVMAVEKGYMPDREQYLRMMSPPPAEGDTRRSFSAPLEQQALRCRDYMGKYGLTREHLAWVSSKNHVNASLNPLAQYQKPYSVEEVLADKPVVEPFTRCMCAPNGDGGAAAILCSAEFARKQARHPIFVATSVMQKGRNRFDAEQPNIDERVSREALGRAGVEAKDIGVLELCDATPWTDITGYWGVGICEGRRARLYRQQSHCAHRQIPGEHQRRNGKPWRAVRCHGNAADCRSGLADEGPVRQAPGRRPSEDRLHPDRGRMARMGRRRRHLLGKRFQAISFRIRGSKWSLAI
jgi:hypothetical protein